MALGTEREGTSIQKMGLANYLIHKHAAVTVTESCRHAAPLYFLDDELLQHNFTKGIQKEVGIKSVQHCINLLLLGAVAVLGAILVLAHLVSLVCMLL
jgi:hypothetical protein